MQRQYRAFTLIELLIVVAIIAILAAIAVPNFLEAQVRSKVARTHSDLRSLATALEAYRVDNNSYPRAELYDNLSERLVVITTPISYISNIPGDPFFSYTMAGIGGFEEEYIYASGNIYFGTGSQFDNTMYLGSIFSLGGRGPDGNINASGYCMAHPFALRNKTNMFGSYDPTNGTISDGDIIRLSSGTMGDGIY